MKTLVQSGLPPWFSLPAEYLRLKRQGLFNLDPWLIRDEEWMSTFRKLFMDKYPLSDIVPFARKEDSEEYACWLAGDVAKVHLCDFSSSTDFVPVLASFNSFWDWFREAVDDMIEYEP